MGPLQGTPHVEILRPITRLSRTLRIADQVLRELDHAVGLRVRRRQPAGPGLCRDSDRRAARDDRGVGGAAGIPVHEPAPRAMPDRRRSSGGRHCCATRSVRSSSAAAAPPALRMH